MGSIQKVFKNAPFPASMAIISLLLSALLYLLAQRWLISLDGKAGLFFLPSLCFAIVAMLKQSGRMKRAASTAATVAVMAASLCLLCFYGLHILFDLSQTQTTDLADYEKTLQLVGFPGNPAANHFPRELPKDIHDAQFSYHSAIAQGGEVLCLKYKTDASSIDNYMQTYASRAKWIGAPNTPEAEKNGVFNGTISVLDYEEFGLPKDVTVYITYSRSYKPGDWNHGKLGLVAISKDNDEILFLFEQW